MSNIIDFPTVQERIISNPSYVKPQWYVDERKELVSKFKSKPRTQEYLKQYKAYQRAKQLERTV